jgi:hypothetical protein
LQGCCYIVFLISKQHIITYMYFDSHEHQFVQPAAKKY